MSDSLHRYALEQTVALGDELGIPMGRLVQQTRKALGLPRDLENELPLRGPIAKQQAESSEFPLNDPPDHPEFETPPTSFDLLTDQKKKCASINRHGNPCGAYRRPGSHLCPFHDPNLAEELQEARSEGGRRSVYQLPVHVETNLQQLPLRLNTRLGVQSSMEAVMRMTLLGRIPPRHATVLMRYFNAAIRNLNSGGFADYERHEYNNGITEVLRAAGLIERDLEEQARNNRLDEISDVRAKREEILQANKTFGYGPPASAPSSPPSPRIGYGPNDIRPFFS